MWQVFFSKCKRKEEEEEERFDQQYGQIII